MYSAKSTYCQRVLGCLISALLFLVPSLTMAQFKSAPAFPGAEGHGRYTTGGRGGTIVHVTNLNDSGTGSFRAAVTGGSNRIIVFDVAGVIALQSDITMKDNLTILGQTAPSPGITVRYYTVRPGANNIVRFIRFRRGQEKDINDGADATWQRNVTKLILDHCSFSWSIDEIASFYDNNNFTMQWCTIGESLTNPGHSKGAHGYGGIWGGKLASFHHNMIAHVMNRGPRFNGGRYLWSGYTSNDEYSTYNWANTVQAENVDFRNCVMYNAQGTCYGGPGGGQINIVNNYFKAGPSYSLKSTTDSNGNSVDVNSSSSVRGNQERITTISVANSGNSTNSDIYTMTSRYYISGNTVQKYAANNSGAKTANRDWNGISYDSGVKTLNGEYYTPDPKNYYGSGVEHTTIDNVSCVKIKMTSPCPVGNVTTHTADQAFSKVLTYAGASLYRDEVDTRYATEAQNGTATYTGSVTKSPGIIDKVSDVNGYTEANFGTASRPSGFDTDNDGIPDAWEDAHGLNKNNASDALTYTLDSRKYYTNIEVYANSLVESLVKAQRADATETFEEYYPTLASTGGSGDTGGSTGGDTGGSTDTPTADALVWDYTSAAPSSSPDNGLTYDATVSDSDKNQLKGIKLNSTGYCYFTKDAVAGTLAVTFGPRSGTNAASVSAYSYASTPSAETLIATTETTTSLATKTIELTAEQNNIYLKRGASTETVITKIVFTPAVTRDTSCDKTLSGNSYTIAEGDKAVSGTQIKGTDITMTYGDDTWKDAATESTKPNGYDYYITGSANPLPTSGAVPTAGCYYKFVPTAAGTLNIAMLVNAGKPIYVVENTSSIGYSIDGTAYSAGSSLAAKTGGILSFPVAAGKTYYVYCSGSKLGIFGWTLTTGSSSGGSSSSGSTVTGTETTPTAKTSNEDQVGLCYTVPATYVGGQGNSSKAIKFNLKNDKIEINVNPNYTITGFTFTGNDNYADNGITISSVTVDGGSTNVLGGSKTFATDKSENSFTVSNINATQKITLTASTPHDNQLNGTIVFTYKYNVQTLALQSTAKTSSRNGSVTLTFNNPMASGTATLNGKTITADADGTSLKFVYTGLDFGKSYTFTISSGVLKDEYNQTYNQPVSITLTTDARPTVTKKAFDKIVSNGTELAAAIAAANSRSDKTTRYRIFVKKGAHVLPTNGTTTGGDGNTYPDPRTHLSGANVSIIGEDYATTSFTNITPDATWDNGYGAACPLEGIGNGDVLIIDKTATESYFQGVTIRTSMGDAHGRDIAVNDQSNKTIMKDCRLWGYQDTYVSNNSNGRFYFDGGVLRGRTDYLCGKGDVYYNKVTLQQVGTGGYAAVPSLPMKYGYIFNECYIKNETSGVTYYLGRPWGKGTPIALFINTKVDTAPLAAGWDEMSNGWPDRFAEYGTKTTSGTAVSTSSRKTTFNSSYTNNPVLTAAEATYYSNMARIMGGSDGWDPTLYTEQCAKPTASLTGSTLTWTADNYASSWIVFKDGEYYANPTTNSLSLTEDGTYTVRAANAMGGLGEASAAVEYKDLTAGGATLAFTAAVQGGSNAAGSTVNQETHYYNNWGASGWAAQAYIGFDVTVPAGKHILSATLTFKSYCGGNYDGRSVDVYLMPKANTASFNTSSMTLSNALGTKVSTETDNRTASLKTITLSTDALAALNELSAADATSRVIFQLGGAAAGATLQGYTSASKPTLTLTFADGAYVHVHSYTYTDNGNGTHTKTCESCGESTTESHTGECTHCNTYWLVDGTTYTNAETKQYGKVTYTRTFTTSNKGVWNALCLPFSINVADYLDQFDIAEIFAFCPFRDTNKDGEVTAEDDDLLIINKKKAGLTTPGKPYLIRPKEAKEYIIEATDGKLHPANASSVTCSTTKNEYVITGLLSSVVATADNNYYYLTASGALSHRTSGSTTIKANRWYMTITPTGYYDQISSGAKASYGIVVIGEELDEATAIRLTKSDVDNGNGAIHTVHGVKINGSKPLHPGLYIKNGRKFIIK